METCFSIIFAITPTVPALISSWLVVVRNIISPKLVSIAERKLWGLLISIVLILSCSSFFITSGEIPLKTMYFMVSPVHREFFLAPHGHFCSSYLFCKFRKFKLYLLSLSCKFIGIYGKIIYFIKNVDNLNCSSGIGIGS